MAIVIDAMSIVENKKRLPCEAFFVDTNILIDYKDPFSTSLEDRRIALLNAELSKVLHYLKSLSLVSHTTVSVAVEYYKHLQVGYYRTQTGSLKFETNEFKKQRANDIAFFTGWDLQIKTFKKLFIKNFPIHFDSTFTPDILETFEGSKVDFGDHLLYNYMISCPEALRCIFTNDSDFYSYEGEFYLLTTNKKIISQARADKKLFPI
ncbi:MAG: hypothetical protein Q8L88_05900 [Bacteroidota bacterium]|nr:hypothetical protein [Bacteroidota bacterium]